MGTRQIDWMAEYLCLYRVLEWANQDNGKSNLPIVKLRARMVVERT